MTTFFPAPPAYPETEHGTAKEQPTGRYQRCRASTPSTSSAMLHVEQRLSPRAMIPRLAGISGPVDVSKASRTIENIWPIRDVTDKRIRVGTSSFAKSTFNRTKILPESIAGYTEPLLISPLAIKTIATISRHLLRGHVRLLSDLALLPLLEIIPFSFSLTIISQHLRLA